MASPIRHGCIGLHAKEFLLVFIHLSHTETAARAFKILLNKVYLYLENVDQLYMRRFLLKLRILLVNAVLLLTVIYAVVTVLIPNTKLFSKNFWIGSAVTFIIILPLIRKLKLLKNRREDNGYTVVQRTNEYEHRLIAKKILKRNLLPNEVVHHINGKKSDNRLINLCVMDRYQHELFHAWLDWKKKKSGRYPSFKEQKRLLNEKHNGIILENQCHFKINTYSSPIRHEFVTEKSKISHVGRSDDFSRKLFSDLRRERNRLAHEQNIPAYLIFKNFTLTEMARQTPEDVESMENIIGVTSQKLRLYGEHFLAVIRRHKKDSEDLKKRKSV